jgi:hypothetical protein
MERARFVPAAGASAIHCYRSRWLTQFPRALLDTRDALTQTPSRFNSLTDASNWGNRDVGVR